MNALALLPCAGLALAACAGPRAGQTLAADECPAPPRGMNVLTAGDLERAGVRRLDLALKGRIPGVQVTEGSRASRVQIRGASSFTPQEPLVVVDGVPVGSRGVEVLASLDTRDVAYVEVVKGPETARYGVRGGAGVIVVQTRTPGCG